MTDEATPQTAPQDISHLADLTPDPRSAPAVRWGVLGAGWIASTFSEAVRDSTASSVVAVGSRDRGKAQEFADAHAAGATAHGSYEELVADPDVDVVYVATPHSHHREHALLAIEAGKHVLVEKAFTRNRAEAVEVLDAARAAGVFVMEAMWTRFLPHVAAIHDVIARGVIGDVVSVSADHGQHFAFDPTHRLYDPALAGGALLDLGVYPVSFAIDVLGAPADVTAVGSLTSTGVDGQISIAFRHGAPGEHGERAHSTLSTTLWSQTRNGAVIAGTRGRIEIDDWFFTPTGFRVVLDDGTTSTYAGFSGEGKQYQAAEVARCVTAGLTESARMTWDGTLAVMRVMDDVRRQVGVVYPGE